MLKIDPTTRMQLALEAKVSERTIVRFLTRECETRPTLERRIREAAMRLGIKLPSKEWR